MTKPIKKEIEKALKLYQQRVADILTKQGVKAHIAGDLNAYKKLAPIRIDFGSVQRGAKEFGVKYGALLRNEGATIIKGKKVAWLADSIKETRKEVSNIITEGVRTGKGTDAIARELRGTLIRDKNYEYTRIARTETGNIQAHASENRYKEEGVEEVDWLCGQNPCPICAQYCGKRYKIGEAPPLLVHPNCTCDKAPVVTRAVRKNIDINSMNDKQIADELWKKTAKDGNEHAIIRNGIAHILSGQKHSVTIKASDIPSTPYQFYHSHPIEVGLSGNDIGNFLGEPLMETMAAMTPTKIHMITKTQETKRIGVVMIKRFKDTYRTKVKGAYVPIAKSEGGSDELWDECIQAATKIMAKEYKFKYEIITR